MAEHPFVRGWDARSRGAARSENPHLAGTLAARQWAAGFDERGQLQLARLEMPPAAPREFRAWWVE